MATTKKPVAKRASAKKTTASKAVAVKKAAPRKSTTKKTTAKRKQAPMQSFHVSRDQPPFTSFKITRQTVYWIILVSFIVFAQLWIIKLQVDVASLIEAQQVQMLNDL